MYPSHYGDGTHVVVPPKVYETMQALGYHHQGKLHTTDHHILGNRALKERAAARKGVPGLRTWLACNNAVLPSLREPPPRWQAPPKDWILGAVLQHQAQAMVGGRVAKTTKEDTIYHKGLALRVSTAMKETMDADRWASEL